MFFRSVYQESRCAPFRRCVLLSFLLARWQESNGWMRLRGWWIGAQFARYEARWVIQRALPADSHQMGKEGASEGGWYVVTLVTSHRVFWTLSCGTFETQNFDCSGSEHNIKANLTFFFLFFSWSPCVMTFVRATEFRGQKKKLPWKLEAESFFPHVTWMHHETEACGKGGSLLLFFFSSFFGRRGSSNTSGLFPPALRYPPDPPALSPSPNTLTPRPSLVFTVWSFLHRLWVPAVGSQLFFIDGGGLVMNLQGTHTDTGRGRDTFMNMENENVRETGGELATVKLIRTSCLSLPPFYLWEALMWLSAWKLNEKCIIAFPFTVSPPFLSSPFPISPLLPSVLPSWHCFFLSHMGQLS